MKSRIFNVMQYECHPETGDVLLLEEQIQIAVAHKSIGRWAYIMHDSDTYTQKDFDAYVVNHGEEPTWNIGDTKPRHWHIVIEMKSNQVEVTTIAKWLGIQPNYVNVARGHGAFLDCVRYLTHEDFAQQALGKHLYDDSKIHANFEFRVELEKRAERKAKYGKDVSDEDAIGLDVLYNGMTLTEVQEKYPTLYKKSMSLFEKYRLKYIEKFAPMPPMRINYYVEGHSGDGKGLTSKALARALFDPDGMKMDNEIFFEIGADQTTFEGYDGQPCIIWNDCRAITLLQKLGGRENVYNTFDPYPPNIKQNIKYGSIRLINSVNIVNSIDGWQKFLDELSGDYTDRNGNHRVSEEKAQSYRRFPFFIVVHPTDYVLGMNKGMFDGTREYEQYYMTRRVQCCMKNVAEACGDNLTLYNCISKKALSPVVKKHEQLAEILHHPQQGTDEEIMEKFASYGTFVDSGDDIQSGTDDEHDRLPF